MTHWQSPQFHGYYPTGSCFASMVGELMCAGMGVVGFNWVSCYNFFIIFFNFLKYKVIQPSVLYK